MFFYFWALEDIFGFWHFAVEFDVETVAFLNRRTENNKIRIC